MKLQAFWISSCSIQTANPWHWHGSSQSLRFEHNTWQEPLDLLAKTAKSEPSPDCWISFWDILTHFFTFGPAKRSKLELFYLKVRMDVGVCPFSHVPLWQTLGNKHCCEEQISWSIIQSNPSIQRFAHFARYEGNFRCHSRWRSFGMCWRPRKKKGREGLRWREITRKRHQKLPKL